MILGFTEIDLDGIAAEWMDYVIRKGYCVPEDKERAEENGCIDEVDTAKVSDLAKKRRVQQPGIMGAGRSKAVALLTPLGVAKG